MRTVDELCEAIETLRKQRMSVMPGNIAEELGLGETTKDMVCVHELIVEAFRQERIEYVGCGEYRIYTNNDPKS